MAVRQLGNDRTTAYADGTELVMERDLRRPARARLEGHDRARSGDRTGGARHGYTTIVEEMDVRPGGRWRWISHTTGGEDVPFKGEYLEVVPPERFVQTSSSTSRVRPTGRRSTR